MKAQEISGELKNYKIREGYLAKRSRVLREWRKRWIVLTFNYLFSFENDASMKPTQIIDLNEVVSLRSKLKTRQGVKPTCFSVETKLSDFAFSASQVSQKWSWIVTIERLLDFKQKGATNYNNMDQIKNGGFQSQNQFLFLQKSRVRNMIKTGKTISIEEEAKKNELKTNQYIQKLMEEHEKILQKQLQIQREQKILQEERNTTANFKQKIEELSLQIRSLQQGTSFWKEGTSFKASQIFAYEKTEIQRTFKEDISENKYQNRQNQQIFEVQLTQEKKALRCRYIQSLLQQFSTAASNIELAFIVDFFLKITEKKEYKYQEIIILETHRSKHLGSFMTTCLYLIKIINPNEFKLLKRALVFLQIIFKDQQTLQAQYFFQAERIALQWTVHYTKQTPKEILQETISLLDILFKSKGQLQGEQTTRVLEHMLSLAQDQEFRQRCNSILKTIQGEKH